MGPKAVQLIQKRVPTGWLVIAGVELDEGVMPLGVTFIPDPNHEWEAERKIVLNLDRVVQ
jgi:hypothetical protein